MESACVVAAAAYAPLQRASDRPRYGCASIAVNQPPWWFPNADLAAAIVGLDARNERRDAPSASEATTFIDTRGGGATTLLDESQLRAFDAARGPHPVSLINGPSGTGKTAVAVRILAHWAASDEFGQDEPPQGLAFAHLPQILAVSESQIAVDALLDGLLRARVRALRVGKPAEDRSDLTQHSIDCICADAVNACRAAGGSERAAHAAGRDARDRALRRCRVLVATCVGAGAKCLRTARFRFVLVDEAAHATELAALVPVARGCERLVLVGDHCQLPPTVASRAADAAGLVVSLFQRLARRSAPVLLATQYRASPALARFPLARFYGSSVYDAAAVLSVRDAAAAAPPSVLRGFAWPRQDMPVAFVPLPLDAAEERDGDSITNAAEVEAVLRIARDLVAAGDVSAEDVGVITPYAAQARRLRSALRAAIGDCARVDVASVDGFQGREKEVVIVSTVHANARGEVGCLADWRRANVALTRARRALVVVGHAPTLAREACAWRPWLDWACAQGCVAGTLDALPINLPLAADGDAAAIPVRRVRPRNPSGAAWDWGRPPPPLAAANLHGPEGADEPSDDGGASDGASVDSMPSVQSPTRDRPARRRDAADAAADGEPPAAQGQASEDDDDDAGDAEDLDAFAAAFDGDDGDDDEARLARERKVRRNAILAKHKARAE
ncbi:P-loop containing nucleoside triphosphate hydrolase protein [Pelagophyceae sp. CCMP2097]|nr:P-loop containing nucleoside triphosphate hydrolase protein [Pelagophyceae sp. CCMP2097]